MTHVLIIFLTLGVYCALAEKSEFPMTTELSPKKHPVDSEDKLLENVTRAKNSSHHILDNNSEEDRNADKKSRTVHRDSSLDRDKSTSSSCDRSFYPPLNL